MKNPVQVILMRGKHPECIHEIHVAVCDAEGQLTHEWGDPHYETYWRSGAKPFQVLPILLHDGIEKFNFSNKDLAIMSSSHSGEPEHIKQVKEILGKIGCTEKDLECGVMRPLNREVAEKMLISREPFTAIHNTCSGKHAGMLALAKLLNIDTKGYIRPDHPVQIEMKEAIARSVDIPSSYIDAGVDGCGVPVFWLAISGMARGYGKLADPQKAHMSDDFTQALGKIQKAIQENPFYIAGTERFETVLMEETKGKLLAKSGTDGIFCVSHLPSSEGLVLKVVDGNSRAFAPATLSLLKEMNWISGEEYLALWNKSVSPLKNHRGDLIGDVQVIF